MSDQQHGYFDDHDPDIFDLGLDYDTWEDAEDDGAIFNPSLSWGNPFVMTNDAEDPYYLDEWYEDDECPVCGFPMDDEGNCSRDECSHNWAEVGEDTIIYYRPSLLWRVRFELRHYWQRFNAWLYGLRHPDEDRIPF